MEEIVKAIVSTSSALPITANHTSFRTLKPPAFDGQTSWSIYKTQFEAVAKANHWDDQERETALILAHKGPTAEVLLSIPAFLHFDAITIINALERRYGGVHLKQVYRSQIRTRTHKPGETLQQLAQEGERLTLLSYSAYDPEHREDTATESFINAISDQELQQAVRQAEKRTVKDALAYSMSFAAAKNATRNTATVREVVADECRCERLEINREPRCKLWRARSSTTGL